MHEKVATIKTFDNFATAGGNFDTTATIPTSVTGCGKAVDCALQFYWHSLVANQTHPTCADITIGGSCIVGSSTTCGSACGRIGGTSTNQEEVHGQDPPIPKVDAWIIELLHYKFLEWRKYTNDVRETKEILIPILVPSIDLPILTLFITTNLLSDCQTVSNAPISAMIHLLVDNFKQ
ncbi:hypothetical protein FI667_g9289, partial [Globisporangium splendens]